MERQGDEVHFETDEARGASSPNIVRWVLGISLFAAIALLSVIWITGAATQGEGESVRDERDRALQEYGVRGGVLASEADEATGVPDAPAPGQTSEPGAPPSVANEAAGAPTPPAAD